MKNSEVTTFKNEKPVVETQLTINKPNMKEEMVINNSENRKKDPKQDDNKFLNGFKAFVNKTKEKIDEGKRNIDELIKEFDSDSDT